MIRITDIEFTTAHHTLAARHRTLAFGLSASRKMKNKDVPTIMKSASRVKIIGSKRQEETRGSLHQPTSAKSHSLVEDAE